MKQKIDYNLLIIAGIFGVAYFGGRKILQSFGLISDQRETRDLRELQSENYFNPTYWQQFGAGALILTESDAKRYSDTIKDAYGIFNDDENAIYAVFELLKTKSQVSYLALKFNQYYNISLLGYLQSFLNDAELAKVAGIINKKPKYKL